MSASVTSDLAVVGLGAIGSMVLRDAARRGLDAVGIEQFEPGHERGASGGSTRIFRAAYKEGVEYVPLLLESRRQWEELQAATTETVWQPTGALTIGDPGNEEVGRLLDSVRLAGPSVERFGAAEAMRRWPQHRYLPDDAVIFDPLGGLLRPDVAIRAAVQDAEQHGARALAESRVVDIRDTPQRVDLTLGDGRTVRARRVLLALGPWASTFVPEATRQIQLRRVILHWFRTADTSRFGPDAFPVGIRRSGPGREFSFFPRVDDFGIKINFHVQREVLGAMEPTLAAVDPGFSQWVGSRIPDVLNDVQSGPARAQAFVDGYTADYRPVLGPVPGRDRVFAAFGGSGQAFKMSPALARLAVDLMNGDDLGDYPVTPLSVRDKEGVRA